MISGDIQMNTSLDDVKATLSNIAIQIQSAMDSLDTEALSRLLKARSMQLDSIPENVRTSPEYRAIIDNAINENGEWLIKSENAKQLIKSRILSVQTARLNKTNIGKSYNARPGSGRIFSKNS